MTESTYVPPKVWTWDSESGGRFASINRPISGATHDKELPRGEHPFQLYSLATPNGVSHHHVGRHRGWSRGCRVRRISHSYQRGRPLGSGFVAANPNPNPALSTTARRRQPEYSSPARSSFISPTSLALLSLPTMPPILSV